MKTPKDECEIKLRTRFCLEYIILTDWTANEKYLLKFAVQCLLSLIGAFICILNTVHHILLNYCKRDAFAQFPLLVGVVQYGHMVKGPTVYITYWVRGTVKPGILKVPYLCGYVKSAVSGCGSWDQKLGIPTYIACGLHFTGQSRSLCMYFPVIWRSSPYWQWPI